MRIPRICGAALAVLAVSATLVASAGADSIGPTTFESPTFSPGDIDGQDGWKKTGAYDVEVASVSSFPDAALYGFGDQALRLSNAVVSGGFGDQTFSPGLASPAGEAPAQTHFETSFKIGTTQAVEQPGLSISVSPDDGNGARMSYLRFDDQADGVHVVFYDVTDAGPLPTVATFNPTDIATIDRAHSHTVRFSIDFVPGPANDVVKIYIDGVLKITGTTWEDYYRYDPEQTGGGNVLSPVAKLGFFMRGTSEPGTAGDGFLVDDVSLASSTPAVGPTNKSQCKHGGWKSFSNPSFKNQGACVSFVAKQGHGKKRGHGHHADNATQSKPAGSSETGNHSEHGKDSEQGKENEQGKESEQGKENEQGKQGKQGKQGEHGKQSDHGNHGAKQGRGGKGE